MISATSVARSIEMLLEVPFSSTVRLCSVIPSIQNGLYTLSTELVYSSELLSVRKTTNDRRLTLTNCSMENLGVGQMSWSK